jgi:hypothetical protein
LHYVGRAGTELDEKELNRRADAGASAATLLAKPPPSARVHWCGRKWAKKTWTADNLLKQVRVRANGRDKPARQDERPFRIRHQDRRGRSGANRCTPRNFQALHSVALPDRVALDRQDVA